MELDTKSLEESQGPLEKIPCTGEVDPTEETHETFQEGFFEEIPIPMGIAAFSAGCIIGHWASWALLPSLLVASLEFWQATEEHLTSHLWVMMRPPHPTLNRSLSPLPSLPS